MEITCISRGPLRLRAGTSGCREVSLELWGEVPAGCGFGSCGHLDGEGPRTGVVGRGGAPGIPAGVGGQREGGNTVGERGQLQLGSQARKAHPDPVGLWGARHRWKGCSIGGHAAPATA